MLTNRRRCCCGDPPPSGEVIVGIVTDAPFSTHQLGFGINCGLASGDTRFEDGSIIIEASFSHRSFHGGANLTNFNTSLLWVAYNPTGSNSTVNLPVNLAGGTTVVLGPGESYMAWYVLDDNGIPGEDNTRAILADTTGSVTAGVEVAYTGTFTFTNDPGNADVYMADGSEPDSVVIHLLDPHNIASGLGSFSCTRTYTNVVYQDGPFSMNCINACDGACTTQPVNAVGSVGPTADFHHILMPQVGGPFEVAITAGGFIHVQQCATGGGMQHVPYGVIDQWRAIEMTFSASEFDPGFPPHAALFYGEDDLTLNKLITVEEIAAPVRWVQSGDSWTMATDESTSCFPTFDVCTGGGTASLTLS